MNETQAEKIISLTPAAEQHIKSMLAKQKTALGFRLSVKKVGCSGLTYVPELVQQNQVNNEDVMFFTANGLQIFVDKQWVDALRGTVVDLSSKGIGQTQLVYQNPNVANECGCGESFHLKEEKD